MTKPTPLLVSLADLLKGQKVESDRIEFKEGWNPSAILRTVCAFANDFHNNGNRYPPHQAGVTIWVGAAVGNGPILGRCCVAAGITAR